MSRIEIEYCTRCKFLLRAAWLAHELLAGFEGELTEVTLVPGSGGVFEVRIDGAVLFANKSQGRLPEATEIKQLVRDRVAPDRAIGHR